MAGQVLGQPYFELLVVIDAEHGLLNIHIPELFEDLLEALEGDLERINSILLAEPPIGMQPFSDSLDIEQ